jgi:hypothetical protein
MSKIIKIEYIIDENECHICTSHTFNLSNYYKTTVNGKQCSIHRYLYIQKYGEIPKGLVIRHKCNNPKCINIEHLQIGTHADNVQDRVNHNRSAIGENNGRAKLTEENVKYIRQHSELNNTFLGKKFGVNRCLIREIKKGNFWKHIL